MQTRPGPPDTTFGQGGPASALDPDQALFDLLAGSPIQALNLPTTAAGLKLLGQATILVGWSLRETTGTAPAEVEFIDGPDANASVVAEDSIGAPPSGAAGGVDTDVDNSATGAAGAIAATLPNAAGQTTFITGFEVTGGGATAASVVVVTVTGILGGTKSYDVAVPAGVTLGISPLLVQFSRPIPASAVNTAIVVNVPNLGAGNTQAAVTAHGFQRLAGASGAAAGQSVTRSMPGGGILCRSGLFMRVITGSVTGAVWAKF